MSEQAATRCASWRSLRDDLSVSGSFCMLCFAPGANAVTSFSKDSSNLTSSRTHSPKCLVCSRCAWLEIPRERHVERDIQREGGNLIMWFVFLFPHRIQQHDYLRGSAPITGTKRVIVLPRGQHTLRVAAAA